MHLSDFAPTRWGALPRFLPAEKGRGQKGKGDRWKVNGEEKERGRKGKIKQKGGVLGICLRQLKGEGRRP